MDMTLPAPRVETILQQDGTLTLEHLPFRAGQAVEVSILAHPTEVAAGNRYPLRGTELHYERPTDPVAVEDWGALQ